MQGSFDGRRGRFFWLALRTGIFTILTLGFYRFWMKTRLRRWTWSAIRMGGLPLEYTGLPGEKILGFFVAVVLLTLYIALVNLGLTFFSVSVLQDIEPAYALTFAGVVPLWFYAQYRARRYILARTRWRGIRFGQTPGAWGFALRALLYWALTVVSLGLLWPLMTHQLEAFKANRTHFGDATLRQGGRWWHLYPAFLPFLTLSWLLGLMLAGQFAPAPVRAILDPALSQLPSEQLAAASFGIGFGSVFALPLFYAIYVTAAFRRLTRTKTLNGAALSFDVGVARILWIHISGTLLSLLAMGAALAAIAFVAAAATGTPVSISNNGIQLDGAPPELSQPALLALGVFSYFTVFLLWSVMRQTFVSFPLLRYYTRALRLSDPARLTRITQRTRDDAGQAEGFADALDVGASL